MGNKSGMLGNVQLQFISHYTDRFTYQDSIAMALDGGCRWVQLRMKGANENEILTVAEEVLEACRDNDATFIIDDHVELVKKIHADGVHLGKSDMPAGEARKILGDDYIIGGTANTVEDVLRLVDEGVDYIGCGPFRFTTTKSNLSPIIGLEGYRKVMETLKAKNISTPIIAIGGIKLDDIPEILKTGVRGVALSGSVLQAEDPVEKMREFVDCIG